MCGLCPQVVSDLSEERQRSGGSTHAQGLPQQASMFDLTATGGYGLHTLPPRMALGHKLDACGGATLACI